MTQIRILNREICEGKEIVFMMCSEFNLTMYKDNQFDC